MVMTNLQISGRMVSFRLDEEVLSIWLGWMLVSGGSGWAGESDMQ